ncbi:hypothetical protein BpHYR1_041623 [Brachionus plicatilis]|uniref:Uncharacterized protein n=1 Tax=Brachionus plicatilis TaxID=10195 RepID=A0A3M7RGT1_BRAPC|nr:hypothetical protein BpHYR1_041623 [Brachionus plicatilis]
MGEKNVSSPPKWQNEKAKLSDVSPKCGSSTKKRYEETGFGDTRGDQIDIANVFFREHVAKKVENIKIMFLLSFSDTVEERGGQFRTSLKELKRIFGVLESEQKDDPALEINLSE